MKIVLIILLLMIPVYAQEPSSIELLEAKQLDMLGRMCYIFCVDGAKIFCIVHDDAVSMLQIGVCDIKKEQIWR